MRALPSLSSDLDPSEVIAALSPLLGPARCARLDAIAAGRLVGVAAVLDDLYDPHNYGAVLRSCEAMGLLHVHTINVKNRYRVSPRVTQGSQRWLDIHAYTGASACAAAVRAAGYRLLCAVPGAPLALDEIDPAHPVALAFGNEHLGLSPELRALADGEFRIPMYGASESLNVSVSVAVAVHAATAARRRLVGAPGDLDGPALLALRARYYAADQRGHRGVIERHRREKTGEI